MSSTTQQQRLDFKPPQRIHFDYINTEDAVVLNTIRTDMASKEVLLCVGNPENASYEWVVQNDTRVIAHSNCGYGMCSAALRDGLLAACGYPNNPIEPIEVERV